MSTRLTEPGERTLDHTADMGVDQAVYRVVADARRLGFPTAAFDPG